MPEPKFGRRTVLLAPLLAWGMPCLVGPAPAAAAWSAEDLTIDVPLHRALAEVEAESPGTERPPPRGRTSASRSLRSPIVHGGRGARVDPTPATSPRAWPGLLGMNTTPAIPPPAPPFTVLRS